MGSFFKFFARFFHGLDRRQKTGFFVLLVAWAFMFGWVRSHFFVDEVWCPSGFFSTDSISSSKSFLYWGSKNYSELILETPGWRSGRFASGPNDVDDPNITWYGAWHVFGVEVVEGNSPLEPATTFWIIPYWSVILLLTLISSFLLPSRLRPLAPKKTPAPIPVTVA